jgi:hypothetical protein
VCVNSRGGAAIIFGNQSNAWNPMI